MKRIVAKTGTYTNQQGEEKAEWTKIGVIGTSQNGEYVLLDPAINLSGVLQKQNMMAAEKRRNGDENAKPGKAIMCSIFDDSNQGAAPQQQPPAGAMTSFDEF